MNAPKLRFKEFNDEWITYKFYDLVSIINGQVDPNKKEYCNLPHIGPGNIEKETGRLLEYNLAKDDKLISSKYLFNEKSVIYGKINPHFAKVCYPKFVGLCSADSYPINPIEEKLTSTFLLYLLLNPKFTKFATSVSMRTGMPKINRDELGIYKFTIPKINEQIKIGDFLSLLDKKIELQSKKIEDLKLFKKGLHDKLFNEVTGNVYLLSDIAIFENGKGHENIVDENGKYILINSKFISTEGNVTKKCSEQLTPLFKNDITMVMSDLPNGKALAKCYYIDENNKYSLNQRICKIKIKDDSIINSKYLFYLLDRNPYYLRFDDGVNQTNLKKDDILSLNLVLPSIKDQERNSKTLTIIDNFIEKENNKLSKLNLLKKGLMQSMFV